MSYPFSNTVDIFEADDLSIANLECTLSSTAQDTIEWFGFKADPSYAQILQEGSIEFAILANNHVMDYGQGPYEDTREALDAVGISYAGEDEWYIYETDRGLKVGIYAIYNQLTGNYLDGVSDAQEQKVLEESQEMLSQALEEMKAAGAEFTIACIHMGTEGPTGPRTLRPPSATTPSTRGIRWFTGATPTGCSRWSPTTGA